MKADSISAVRAHKIYLRAEDCLLADLAALTDQKVDLADYPLAADVQKNILIYNCNDISKTIADPEGRKAVMAEWVEAMQLGPGVVVLKYAETDLAMLDRASDMFRDIIADQHASGEGGGDHFAKPGANDRVWNSLGKHCLKDPANFAQYYGNEMLALISEAWLGPHYQVTAQLNVVNPGGAAQSPHRDYHLGFLKAEDPLHVQLFSPFLTLQGANAHVDATEETGPTKLLPFSQAYEAGYLAVNRPEFKAFFEEHHVQLPLEKGDMLFFSPALFHAAGTNRSKDIKRMVNLFQVGSAYGRSIEAIDRDAMCKALYPVLRASEHGLNAAQVGCAIAACAEGYAFPTNLDTDPPLGGLAPKTQAMLFKEALAGKWSTAEFSNALDHMAARKIP
jgi:ectoine hydroxylase-related dioxygenase (phytanoyl-CoA dioxygenase family)